jgi:hypothetical protein
MTVQIARESCNMQGMYFVRLLTAELRECLDSFPAVAVLGPRRCGKSTLAKAVIGGLQHSLYLDLEKPSDRAKLAEPELFLDLHKDRLVCLDEIQRAPELFPVLRAMIDQHPRPGRFLILGSASRELIRQSSETLAGRIAFLELSPFLFAELQASRHELLAYQLRGGFPESLLAVSEAQSLRWRHNFVRTFLERDLPQLGVRIPAGILERLWTMCAHSHGQLLNQSQLGAAAPAVPAQPPQAVDQGSKDFPAGFRFAACPAGYRELRRAAEPPGLRGILGGTGDREPAR